MKNKVKTPEREVIVNEIFNLAETLEEKRKKVTAAAKAPELKLSGDMVRDYVMADLAYDNAKRARDAAAEKIEEYGLGKIYETNFGNTESPVTSVKVIDETGSEVIVQNKAVYRAYNPKEVCEVMTSLKLDPSKWLEEVAVLCVDPSAFLNEDGDFYDESFSEFANKVKAIAMESGLEDAVSVDIKNTVKGNFHRVRNELLTPSKNVLLRKTLPNTVSLTHPKLGENAADKAA